MSSTPTFDIAINQKDGHYFIKVLAATGVKTLPKVEPFVLPDDLKDTAAVYHKAADIMRQYRELGYVKAINPEIKNIGTQLFTALFRPKILKCFNESRKEIGRRLLCLRLQIPPNLDILPWELLREDTTHGNFIERNDQSKGPLTIVRCASLRDTYEREGDIIASPPRIIVVHACPEESIYSPDMDDHINSMENILSKGNDIFIIKGRSTLNRIREEIQHKPNILHILCYSSQDNVDCEEFLSFVDINGIEQQVNAEIIRREIIYHGNTYMIFLHAFQGMSLLDNGKQIVAGIFNSAIPALITLQFDIPNDIMIVFVKNFYHRLLEGDTIVEALVKARYEISIDKAFSLYWAAPVLFLNTNDTVLFIKTDDIAIQKPESDTLNGLAITTKERDEKIKEIERLKIDLRFKDALNISDYLFEKLPHDKEIERIREEVINMYIDSIYDYIIKNTDSDEWEEVIDRLDEVDKYKPEYDKKHNNIRSEYKKRENCYIEAYNAFKGGNWRDTINNLAGWLKYHPKDEILQTLHIDALEASIKQENNSEKLLQQIRMLIEQSDLRWDQRLRAARIAGKYGDIRFGIYTLQLERCSCIKAGNYEIGRRDSEGKVETPFLHIFKIARYPVTIWQFRQFCDSDGYTNAKWWTRKGNTWLQQELLKNKAFWKNRVSRASNEPVINVSWYEATAFCSWLTARGHADGWLHQNIIIRLPTEAEWEVAARWDSAELQEWSPDRDMIIQLGTETNAEGPFPVGIFSKGRGSNNALDMAGNVWEWCASPYTKDGGADRANELWEDFPGHLPNDNPEFDGIPVQRGGSYDALAEIGWEWDSRKGINPSEGKSIAGFRLCLAFKDYSDFLPLDNHDELDQEYQELREQLIDLLCAQQMINTYSGREAILLNIPADSLSRDENNKRTDINMIVSGLYKIGRLRNGNWPLLLLIDNTKSYFPGTEVEEDLTYIQVSLSRIYTRIISLQMHDT